MAKPATNPGKKTQGCCAIAIGSNLGDRFGRLCEARRMLESTLGSAKVSPIYQTEPVDCPAGSLPFLNAVMVFPCPDSAESLHRLTLKIETEAGRAAKRLRNSPRPIDLDLLVYGNDVIHTPDLEIPHPRLHLRRFVLQPLADVWPDLILPGFTTPVSVLLAGLKSPEPPLRVFAARW